MNARRINLVWLVLVLATGATFAVGEIGARLGLAGPPAMAVLLALSFIKGRLVLLDFMALRGVRLLWRSLLLGWLLVVSALIAVAYWIALK